MKFRVQVTYEYEVDMDDAQEAYGTTDVPEMVAIDRKAIEEDPGIVAADLTNGYTVTVAAVE